MHYARLSTNRQWAQVIGPGDRLENDFLPNLAIANALAFRRTLESCAFARKMKEAEYPLVWSPLMKRGTLG